MREFLSSLVLVGLVALVTPTMPAAARAADVDDLIGGLSADSAADRVAAADELGRLGPNAAPATAMLSKALNDKDETVRWHAARALGAIGPAASDAIPKLTAALTDDSAMVRAQAARALGKMGKGSEGTFEAVTKLLVDPEPFVRRAAMGAARELSPGPQAAVAAFAKLLADTDPAIVVTALNGIVERGDEAVPMLNEALTNEKTQYWACVGLMGLGPKAAPAVPNLTKLIDSKYEEVRLHAMLALAEIGEAARPATPQLIKALDDPQVGVRYGAAYALGEIQAQGADEALEKAAQSDDKFLAMLCKWALARTNPKDEARLRAAAEALTAGLQDEDAQTRNMAMRALSQLDAPQELRDKVVKVILNSPYPDVLPAAIEAMAARGAAVVGRIVQRLDDPKTRLPAVRVLARMGPEAKEAVPALVTTLKDSDPQLAEEINFALGAIGPDAKAAVPVLTEMVNSENSDLRYSAVYALGEIGPDAKPAGRALVGILNKHRDDDPLLTLASAWSLARIYPHSPNAAKTLVPVLITGLKDERPRVRAQSAQALGDFGPDAKSAADALHAALDDKDEQVRTAAASALEKIE